MVMEIATADITAAVVGPPMTRTSRELSSNSLDGTLPREWSALGSLTRL